LRGLGIPELCSPELTGDWEFKLHLMSRGKLKREDFMKEIADAIILSDSMTRTA